MERAVFLVAMPVLAGLKAEAETAIVTREKAVENFILNNSFLIVFCCRWQSGNRNCENHLSVRDDTRLLKKEEEESLETNDYHRL
jgi:hypothetical protein